MNYLSAQGLSRSLGDRVLFEDLTFGLSRGDKVALIANNGTGKTSLLNILAGLEPPETGTVALREGIYIGYLRQSPELKENLSIGEMIRESNSSVLEAIREYDHALKLVESGDVAGEKAMEKATQKMDARQAWDYERRLVQMLDKFKVNDHQKLIAELSGGQKKRLSLALVLLDHPDLLILDEPTNHLDIDMIEWLEKYLSQQQITLLMVTHDRYFLDQVCNRILEMHQGKLYNHQGNYAYFLEKKEEREKALDTEASRAGQLLKKELEWMRRMPKARTTKSKSRIAQYYDLEDKAHSRSGEKELQISVKPVRIGGKILELKKVRKQYGDQVLLNGFDYVFKKGERIGIVGRNGTGKTTFLQLITGNIEPDGGKIVMGDTMVVGYYKQEDISFSPEKKVIEVLKEIAEVFETAEGRNITASQFLTRFLFPPHMHYTPVGKLSGGEQRRLYLLTILIKNPNFLILDEPTNDLDILTLNVLEDFLFSYQGCLIIVSHDRYFMDMLADHLFIFKGNGVIQDYNGTYSEYRYSEENLDEVSSVKPEKEAVMEKPKTQQKGKLSFKEKHEYDQLQSEISTLENERLELEQRLSGGSAGYEEIGVISERLGVIHRLIDEKEMRWLELDELGSI